MKRTAILPLLLIFGTVWSQSNKISLHIIDSNSKKAVPYAAASIKTQSYGIHADDHGYLILTLPDSVNSDDYLQFSCIGYKSAQIKLSNIRDTVFLEPSTKILDEVHVEAKKLRARILGKNEHGAFTHVNIYHVYDSLDRGEGREFGSVLKINRNCRIESFNFYLSSNTFGSLTFRIQIYRMDNKTPSEHRIQRDVIHKVTESGTGWVSVDLTDHDIWLNDETVLASAQLVDFERPDSAYPALSIPVITPTPFNGFAFRSGSNFDWSINTAANPSIFLEAFCE